MAGLWTDCRGGMRHHEPAGAGGCGAACCAVDQDPPVTKGAEQRYVEISKQWAGIKADMNRIIDHDVADFNKLLDDSGIGHIIVP